MERKIYRNNEKWTKFVAVPSNNVELFLLRPMCTCGLEIDLCWKCYFYSSIVQFSFGIFVIQRLKEAYKKHDYNVKRKLFVSQYICVLINTLPAPFTNPYLTLDVICLDVQYNMIFFILKNVVTHRTPVETIYITFYVYFWQG